MGEVGVIDSSMERSPIIGVVVVKDRAPCLTRIDG